MLVYGLLHGYQQCLPDIRHQWPELLELYTFAEQSGFQQQSEVPRGVRPERSASVETRCAQIALLSAPDPLHLAYGEVWVLFAELAQPHAADLLLSPCEGLPRSRAQWVTGGAGEIDTEDEDTSPSAHLCIADSWRLTNQSQTGICLTRERRSQNLPIVGELLDLRAATEEDGDEKSSPWKVGIVRWLTADSRDAQRMSFELLSSNARPVHLATAAAAPGQLKPAALVLAAKDKEQIRMIVPTGTYRPDEPTTVDFNDIDISQNQNVWCCGPGHIQCIYCVD